MDGEGAERIMNALVWGAQKARSITTENLGDDEATQEALATIEPYLFGPRSILPQLLSWQARVKMTRQIRGADLFNFFKLCELKVPGVLMSAAANGYELPEEADVAWFTETWELP